jgi:site-specific recombinase XerD
LQRHSFATDYLRNGGKMLALQELLGRSDFETVRRYAKFTEADIARDHAITSPVLGCGFDQELRLPPWSSLA